MAREIEAVYEHGMFRPLQPVDLAEGQRVRLSVEPSALTLAEAEAEIRMWQKVYEGLSEQEIAEIEAIALDRGNLGRERHSSVGFAGNGPSAEEIVALARKVYEGLSEQEINEIEAIALDRSNSIPERESK